MVKDKGDFKDIEYSVGKKYKIVILGNYIEEGECMLYSEECGSLVIREATPELAAAPTSTSGYDNK